MFFKPFFNFVSNYCEVLIKFFSIIITIITIIIIV